MEDVITAFVLPAIAVLLVGASHRAGGDRHRDRDRRRLPRVLRGVPAERPRLARHPLALARTPAPHRAGHHVPRGRPRRRRPGVRRRGRVPARRDALRAGRRRGALAAPPVPRRVRGAVLRLLRDAGRSRVRSRPCSCPRSRSPSSASPPRSSRATSPPRSPGSGAPGAGAPDSRSCRAASSRSSSPGSASRRGSSPASGPSPRPTCSTLAVVGPILMRVTDRRRTLAARAGGDE